MDLEHIAGELADTFANGMFTGHAELHREELKTFLFTAFQEVERRTLGRAMAAPPTARRVVPEQTFDAFQEGYKCRILDKNCASRALIDKPAPPDTTPAVTTGPNADPLTLETAGLQDRVSELEAPDPLLVAPDNGSGFLEVGVVAGEIVINLPRDMTGHIKFSPSEASALGHLLIVNAAIALAEDAR